MSGYKEKILERISKLSNADLLEETIEAAVGDDYDGCFTPRGKFEFKSMQEELHKRLKDWLEQKRVDL